MLAIVCRLGFSDFVPSRPDAQAMGAGPALVEPMRADWLDDIIDAITGGGGDDDDDTGDDDPSRP